MHQWGLADLLVLIGHWALEFGRTGGVIRWIYMLNSEQEVFLKSSQWTHHVSQEMNIIYIYIYISTYVFSLHVFIFYVIVIQFIQFKISHSNDPYKSISISWFMSLIKVLLLSCSIVDWKFVHMPYIIHWDLTAMRFPSLHNRLSCRPGNQGTRTGVPLTQRIHVGNIYLHFPLNVVIFPPFM